MKSNQGGGLLFVTLLAAFLWPASAPAGPPEPDGTSSAVHSRGLRGRIDGGKLRRAELVFTDDLVTADLESEAPEPFAYRELRILRGSHHANPPYFDRWDWIILAPSVAVAAASGGAAAAGGHMVTSVAVGFGFYLVRQLLDRNSTHWLSLHSTSKHRCVFLRLPRDKSRRRAVLDELERRDPTVLKTRPPPAAGRVAMPLRPSVGQSPPDFSLPSLDGSHWRLSEARGKAVLLNFWASWCGPCRREVGHLQKLHERFGKAGLEVVAVSDEKADVAKEYLRERGATYRALHDEGSTIFTRYAVRAIPETLIIGPDGVLVQRIDGMAGWGLLRRSVAAVLPEGSDASVR